MAWNDMNRRVEETARLQRDGLYDAAFEHDACGVGFVAALDGKPRRQVVEAGVDALKAVWHRGAVDADGKTGDGAGIQLQIPQDFFKQQSSAPAMKPERAVWPWAWCSCPRPI